MWHPPYQSICLTVITSLANFCRLQFWHRIFLFSNLCCIRHFFRKIHFEASYMHSVSYNDLLLYFADNVWCFQATYILHLLTPWCRVLLEKLTVPHLVQKFPAFHGTRRFITALTSVRQLSLFWANPIQSIYPHPTSWTSVLILSTHLRLGLPSGLFLSGFPTKTLYIPSPHPHAPHAQPISFFSILSPAQYWVSTNHLAPRYAISSIPPLPRPS